MANSEFQRGNKEVPEEIKKWNWGAFSLNIIWGIGNKTYLPLLCLIPLFNLVWVFICGFKGNEWAWRDGNYTDIETFKQVQKTWSRAGIAMFIIQIVIILLYLVFVVFILSSLWYIRDSFIRDAYNYDPYIYDGYYY
ncbi:ribonuclease G [Enterococcus mundtii]|uniref:ribonuclease G n=1 Tax=Enterococcus mundtii TaxID=53346 RepID=UPI0009C117EC|nr:ribonuclease G [Enterococcus mundtii]